MVRAALATMLAVVLLSAGLAASSPAPAVAKSNRLGIAKAKDQVLRPGCHNYRFRYRVKTPRTPWAIEVFLVEPGGDTLANAAFLSNYDPRRGRGKFRFCRASTTYGTFRLRMKVTFCHREDCRAGGPYDRFVKPTKFRLTRPGR